MITPSQRIKLGIFFAVVAGVVVVLIAVFAGLSFEETKPYYVHVPRSVVGLEEGAPVQVLGVRVGAVEKVELYERDFESVQLTLAVNERIRINADAKAFLESQGVGVSGLKFVNIAEGSAKAGPLAPGSFIPLGQTTLERVTSQAEDLSDRVEGLLTKTEALIEGMTGVVRAVDPDSLEAVIVKVDRMASNLEAASREMRLLVQENRGDIRRSTVQARETFAQAEATLDEVEALVSQVRGVVRENSDELRVSMRNLRSASRSFEQLARNLRQQPSRIVFGRPPKERELP